MSIFSGFFDFISDSVGNAMPNREEDVRRTKRNLSRLDYFNADTENGIVTREMDTGIKLYQRDNGLKEDGVLHPRGETERSFLERVNNVGRREPKEEKQAAAFGFAPLAASIPSPFAKAERKKRDPFGRLFNAPYPEPQEQDARMLFVSRMADKASPLDSQIRVSENISDKPKSKKPAEYDATGRMIRPHEQSSAHQIFQKQSHNITTFFPKLSAKEGKYTDGKSSPYAIDRRGETNIGINADTLNEYEKWKKSTNQMLPNNFTKDVKNVTPALAMKIYDEMYYKRYNINKVGDIQTASHLLDISILNGPSKAAKWYQQELNRHLGIELKVDGQIGPATLSAIELAREKDVLADVNNSVVRRRKESFEVIAQKNITQRDFLEGWLNRADSFKVPPVPQIKPLRFR